MAIDPEEPLNLGLLQLGYYTKFVTTQDNNYSAWRRNVDVITWEPTDTLGNDLGDYEIEIRAVPGVIQSNTKPSLLQKLYTDYVLDGAHAHTLGFYSPYTGQLEVSWEQVSNYFSPIWDQNYGEGWSLNSFLHQEFWYKIGWSYEAALYKKGTLEQVTDWQVIYTVTTTDVKSSDNLIVKPVLAPDFINDLQNLNDHNGTTNNYYIDNTVINMSNGDGTENTDKPWWSYLLEAIVGMLNNLIDLIAGIGRDIINGLFDLVKELGVNIVDFFSDLIGNIKNNDQAIDFNSPDLNITDSDLIPMSEFKSLGNNFLRIYLDNKLGYMLVIPLIILLVRLII